MIEKEIVQAIQLLSKNGFRSVSRVTGEYIEKLVAKQLNAELAPNCQKGFDVYRKNLENSGGLEKLKSSQEMRPVNLISAL